MEESVHRQDSFIPILREPMAFLYSLDNSVAAKSSNLGMVNFLSAATFDVEQISSEYVLLLLSVERM